MGNYGNRQCGENSCTHEPRCARTCPAKFCNRLNLPYFGWMGTFMFIWEAVVVLWLVLMLFEVIPQDGWTIAGLLIATVTLATVGWLWNIFNCAPYYSTTQSLNDETLACPLIIRPSAADYVSRIRWDAKQTNDQGHLQTVVKGGIFSLILFAIFIGHSGGPGLAVFDALTATPSIDQVRFYIMSKVFIGLVIAAVGICFNLYLLETHTEFVVRHLVAIGEHHKEKNDTNETSPSIKVTAYTSRNQNKLPGY
jgi:hypothetical protein